MYTVGVCDDHPTIRKALVRGLTQAGHDVVVAHDGREALALLGPERALDAIVMDIGLPDSDGRDVVQALQSGGQRAPVLFLTALGDTHHKLAGFAAGADDYVVKPFDLREVIARVETLARRTASAAPAPGDLVLDPVTHTARTDGQEVHLTPTEFRVLAAVLARRGEVVRRRSVVAAGWPDGAAVSENTLDSFARRVRAKLASIDAPVSLETVRGVGFRVP
ncbi:response regulator transcription factor [Xylanimonas sp. McL0601]|uniref:response regulator transcription factor n=1 Tax=Xylanimonas sp. McL0601 TaxID=3414739 RepID=UPI003CEBDFD7